MPSASTVVATRSIVVTASIGYWPEALSADSITASAPSNTAVATSETSARVGTGVVIIDSSIWVAMTTGLPRRRARRVIVFCRPGTCSSGISTPRSPRATITASETARMSSRRCDRLRLLDLGHHQRAVAGDLLHLDDVLGALDERECDPVDALLQRRGEIGAVLVGHRRGRDRRVGQADAFLVGDAAGDFDDRLGAAGRDCGDAQQHFAVVDQHAMAGLHRAEDFRMRQIDAGRVAELRIGVEREDVALAQLDGAGFEFADPELRVPAGRRECRSAGRTPLRASGSSPRARASPSCEAWLMLMRKTSAPALNRLATTARSAEAGPRVAMILMRRLRRITNVLSFSASVSVLSRGREGPARVVRAGAHGLAGSVS